MKSTDIKKLKVYDIATAGDKFGNNYYFEAVLKSGAVVTYKAPTKDGLDYWQTKESVPAFHKFMLDHAELFEHKVNIDGIECGEGEYDFEW